MLKFKLAILLNTLVYLLYGQTNVAIITDLEKTTQSEFLVSTLIEEIDQTTGVNLKIVSSDKSQFFDIKSVSEAQNAYRNLEADLVISIGGISTKALSKMQSLTTPVIGIGVIDPFIQDIPFENGRSGKKNFTYLLLSRDIIKEIESFKKLVDFDNLTMLIDPAINKSIEQGVGSILLDSIQNELDIQVTIIEAASDVNSVIQEIRESEAVYLSSLISRDREYVSAISDYLIQKKIPSFSTSRQHVEFGILGSSSGDNGLQQIFRRIAIVADDVLTGNKASEIPVAVNTTENFYLNIETARKMEFSAPFEVLLTANLVGQNTTDGKVYSFSEIANIALEKNLDIQISYKDIEAAGLDAKQNYSNIMPYLNGSLTGSRINEERANAAINSPEKSLNLDLSITQVIYSEEVLAAIKIGQYLRNAQNYQTEVDILNVLLDTYNVYLDVLSAKTNLAIQRENLDNTRTNMELAKIRVDIGSSSNADLYRWESELANATQSLIDAQAFLFTARFQLNNLLANSLEDDFEVSDIGVEDELFRSFKNGPLSGFITTPKDLKLASDFLVMESIKQNPNKGQLLENIKAAERQFKLSKRLLYVPTISFQAQTTEVLARGGEGSENPDPGTPTFGTGLLDNSWFMGVSLSYPIFTGLSRNIDKQRNQVQLDQLQYSNTSLDQGLELSIRSSTVGLVSASTNLVYSRQSAESATRNFSLVQSNYRAGTVNITQVIDAQQAALSAQLAAALSVYEFIAANLQIEYGLGFFSMFSAEEELNEFQNRFFEYIANN